MNSEFDILMDMYADMCYRISFLETSFNNLSAINNKMEKLNNSYFDDITKNDPDFRFYKTSTEHLQTAIEDSMRFKVNLKYKIRHICDHEWIKDYIDIDPDKSEKICYCSKCGITQK